MKERMKKRMVVVYYLDWWELVFFLYGKSIAPQAVTVNFLVLLNAISYGFYLIIVKKLMNRYNAFTL
jgi:hypothetical protein